jgi:FkbM family methyltransferase
MNKFLFHSPNALLLDLKTLIRGFLLFIGIEKKYPTQPFSMSDRKKLESAPRYTEMVINFFGKPFYVPDAMTFLSGFKEIYKKEPYSFLFKKEFPCIIDCGANIGLSVIYFKQMYPDADIIAIEPDPRLFNILKKNLDSFGYTDIKLFQNAVWYRNEMLKFKQEGGFSGQVCSVSDFSNVIDVEAISLDLLLLKGNIGFLKLDIEGAENDIFTLNPPDLSNVSNVFIEYHSRNHENQSLHKILESLSGYGFRYHIHHEFITLSPLINSSDLVGMDLQLSIFAHK